MYMLSIISLPCGSMYGWHYTVCAVRYRCCFDDTHLVTAPSAVSEGRSWLFFLLLLEVCCCFVQHRAETIVSGPLAYACVMVSTNALQSRLPFDTKLTRTSQRRA